MHCACLFDVFFSWCQPLCRDVIDKLLDYLDRLPSHISCMTSLGSSIQSLFENRDYVGCGPLFLDCIVKSQVVSWLPCHVMCRLKSKTSWSMALISNHYHDMSWWDSNPWPRGACTNFKSVGDSCGLSILMISPSLTHYGKFVLWFYSIC